MFLYRESNTNSQAWTFVILQLCSLKFRKVLSFGTTRLSKFFEYFVASNCFVFILLKQIFFGSLWYKKAMPVNICVLHFPHLTSSLKKKKLSTIMFIIFWDFLMLEKFFLSPQVKRRVIISNKLVYTSYLTSCRRV